MFEKKYERLEVIQDEVSEFFVNEGIKPSVLSEENFSTFMGELKYALNLISKRKEILFFALLEWMLVFFAYLIWTQFLNWIPQSAWEVIRHSSKSDHFYFLDAALTTWSTLIIVVVSYPLSILNAVIMAIHFLKVGGEKSTIRKAFNLAFSCIGHLWVFTTIDAWITVRAIFDRLPSDENDRTPFDEVLYYAWKIGTMGVVPALISGKGYYTASLDSISLITKAPKRTIGVRMGYSLICWIVGIAGFIGAIFYFHFFGDHKNVNSISYIYHVMVVPLSVAVGIVVVLIRPFFLIMVAKLYTDVIPIDKEILSIMAEKNTNNSSSLLAGLFWFLLCLLLVLYFFGDQLGIRHFIETLVAMDMPTVK